MFAVERTDRLSQIDNSTIEITWCITLKENTIGTHKVTMF